MHRRIVDLEDAEADEAGEGWGKEGAAEEDCDAET